MDALLLLHIESCGLSPGWGEIFTALGMNTIEDLQAHLHTSIEELRLQANEDDEKALRKLLYSCHNEIMDDLLLKHIESCGLSSRWNEIFAGLGINTIEDLHTHLHTPRVEEELRLQANGDEEQAIRKLFYSCVLCETSDSISRYLPCVKKSDEVCIGRSGTLDLPVNCYKEKDLLEKLGLSSYYPEKISLDTVVRKSSQKLHSPSDIPWYVLSKLLVLDYRGRDTIISPDLERNLQGIECIKGSKSSEDELQNLLIEFTGEVSRKASSTFHPSDVMTVIFSCTSSLVRQVICEKLFLCKLAIPFIFPSFLMQEPSLLMWPLRTIYIEKLSSDNNCPLVSAMELPTHVISCLRLGDISQSKSKILNEILNDQSHPTFFHRDCENGMNSRLISVGTVEIAWQLNMPRNNNSGRVDTNRVFLNLRGNAKECNLATNFLLKASDVVLVFVDFQHCTSNCISEFLEVIAPHNSCCIFVVTKQPNIQYGSKEKEEICMFLEKLQQLNFPKERLLFDFEGTKAKNIKILKEEIGRKLQFCLEESNPKVVGNVFKEAASSLAITVDEDDHKQREVRETVYSLQKCIEKQSSGSLKATNLPLQCKPWRKWAEWHKEEHRQKRKGGNTVDAYADKVYKEKKKERANQFQLLRHPSKVFDIFCRNLLNFSDIQRVYFLKWLKMYLDDLSRERLPEQQRKYNLMWNEVSLLDDSSGGEKCQTAHTEQIKKLQDQLKFLEEELAEASFGLEHFMRELAQAYESFVAADPKSEKIIDKNIKDLPRIVAELMKQGFPLELMDGDAAHIPLVWVNAVLENLKKIIGDKKIFVLSVLGIQSSGKSTLLNAMFGLQFAVAAGRCTRGVYAQLLPIPKEYEDNQYDYLLVIDTEGLRASELGEEKLQHDNEIATFVIGIGDMTLVNIKGENVSEIEDVLQIVIHALLKMKLVNKSLALQPSCFFIHQNVPASDAAEKLKLGQLKFMETLNRVTQAAGKHEDKPEIRRFRQLIEFDHSKNIFYFPDLWKGDPPLAPVNPGYSESVSKVKEMLLKDVMPRRSLKIGIQEFSVRLKDLWNGILDQNFIFSFRNSLELEAYSSLESVLADLLWDLKNTAMKWLNTKRNFIANNNCSADSMEVTLSGELRSVLSETLEEANKKLKQHFEGRYAAVLEQWRSRSFNKLQDCFNEIVSRNIKSLKNEIRMKVVEADAMRNVNKYKLLIMTDAKNLANEVSLEECSRILNDEDMRGHFQKKWCEWMEDVDCGYCDEVDDDVENKIRNVLSENFNEDYALVRDSLENVQCASKNLLQQKLSELVEEFVPNSWIHRHWALVPKKFSRDFKKYEVMKIIECKVGDLQSLAANRDKEMKHVMNFIIEKVSEIVRERKTRITINNIGQFGVRLAVHFYEYICNKYYRSNELGKIMEEKIQLDRSYRRLLFDKYPQETAFIEKCFDQIGKKTSVLGATRDDILIDSQTETNFEVLQEAEEKIKMLGDKFERYIRMEEIKNFKEEYVEEIIKMVRNNETIHEHAKFTKKFIIKLAVHMSYVALPVFQEKNKIFKDNLNPVLFLKREYYEICYEIFKSSVSKGSDEKALANILAKQLNKAIQCAIERDIHRELADDVRNNVLQVRMKGTLLSAILCRLLDEDDFGEFILYLDNYNECLQKWIRQFIDEYLYCERRSGSRCKEILLKELQISLSKVCSDISQTSVEVSGKHVSLGDLQLWLRKFHIEVSNKVSVPLDDILRLAEGYEILSIESFKQVLIESLSQSHTELMVKYSSRSWELLENVEGPSVYDIILEECAGCTERCPFCSAPCTLNSADHCNQGIKHMTKEHYSRACAKWRSTRTKKLVTENCTAGVAGDGTFKCRATDYKEHPYKKYQEIFPDWKIHGDISVEASPYWKWFLVKYEARLAEKYHAKRPNIPESWREITKDMARESLRK